MRTWILSGLFVFIAGAAACRSEPAENLAPSATATSSTTELSADAAIASHRGRADAGEDAGLDALCAALLKEEKLDESALRDEDRTSPGPRMHCWSTGRFAWALRVERQDASSALRQTLLFAGSDGARARLASTLDGVEWPPVLGRHAAMFDFDGDGVPEFFGVVPKNLRTYAPAARIFATFKKGAIAAYPTGGSFEVDGLADMDKDGRPDLRVSFQLGKRKVCEASDEGPLEVELAAHSLPDGKFSLNDAAAIAFAERRCPALPAADAMFLPSIDPAASDKRDLSMSYVACSRLRGKSADAVIAELEAACAPNVEATKKCSGPCRHLPDAITVAKFTPPLQLKEAAGDAGAKPK